LITNIANDRTLLGKKFFFEFKLSITEMAKELQALTIQLCWTLHAMVQAGKSGVSQSYVIQVLTFIYSIITLVENMLKGHTTSSYLLLFFQGVLDEDAPAERGRVSTGTLKEFWESDFTHLENSEKFCDGDLNQIIFQFVATEKVDTKRRDTFIICYKSFTNPVELLTALISCYNVPPGFFSPEKSSMVQQNVCDLLEKWITIQYLDLSSFIFRKLKEFVDFSVLDLNQAAKLKTLIENTKRKLTAVENLPQMSMRLKFEVAIASQVG